MDRSVRISPRRPSKCATLICAAASLFVSLPIWSQSARSADASSCVVKLNFSSDDPADSGTNTFVEQVLNGEGYTVIDDWLFTVWSHSDYEVKIIITHTETPNYGFPVSLMGMQLFITNVSGSVLVNSYIDRANLEASLRAFIPACDVSPPLDSKADNNGREVNAR